MIRKVAEGFKVVSEDGKNLGGPYPTMEAAKKRLAEVEMFKHARAKQGREMNRRLRGK